MNVNKDIEEAVRGRLGQAQDDLYRARRAFSRISASDMNLEWGESGKSRASVLQNYEDENRRWEVALRDLLDLGSR